jgi:hypothetical protein
MKITRTITYIGSPEAMKRQLERSLKDGEYDLATHITVKTTVNEEGLEGQNPEGWWTGGVEPPKRRVTAVQK